MPTAANRSNPKSKSTKYSNSFGKTAQVKSGNRSQSGVFTAHIGILCRECGHFASLYASPDPQDVVLWEVEPTMLHAFVIWFYMGELKLTDAGVLEPENYDTVHKREKDHCNLLCMYISARRYEIRRVRKSIMTIFAHICYSKTGEPNEMLVKIPDYAPVKLYLLYLSPQDPFPFSKYIVQHYAPAIALSQGGSASAATAEIQTLSLPFAAKLLQPVAELVAALDFRDSSRA